MLVLKRRPGQSIRVGDNLYVTLVSHAKHEVLLSIHDEVTGATDRLVTTVGTNYKISPGIYVMPTHRNTRTVWIGISAPTSVKVLRTEIIKE